MYTVTTVNGYLLVKFIDDFDLPVLKAAIHHLTLLGDYADCNDIWHIGDYRADISLGDIDLMVSEFVCRCPRDAKRTRTAIVVNDELTSDIFELWLRGLQPRVTFEIKIFQTLPQAEAWLDEGKLCVV